MLGRGVVGRPWLPAALDAALAGQAWREPGLAERLAIVREHLADSLAFYGPYLGLRMFRKHLAAYVEAAPAGTPAQRREARAALCRLECPDEVVGGLAAFWRPGEKLAA
jgi:tRNA-dihydrouridine synthase